jgi:two-component system, sensor histidine kinase YesM
MMLGTVRGRMIANSAFVLFLLAIATLYTSLAFSELARSVDVLFRNNRRMESIRGLLVSTEAGLAGYLTTKSSESLKDYIRFSTKLADGGRSLNREIVRDDFLLLQRDLGGVIDSYLEATEACVTAKRGRDVAAYTSAYEDSERSAELARFLIDKIDGIYLSESLAAYSGFSALIPAVIVSNSLLVVAACLMSLTLLVRFSYKLTGPISRLAEAARAVGRGEYTYQLPETDSSDEIGTMTLAFSRMQASVRRSFEELKEKSEVERRLMEERMRVLELDHRLKDAELLALQTQINPHFLFNTLSAGMQLALSEEADRTADFLDNLAAFIRYTLKPPARSVRVADEIECVERYIWLLRLRFGERYRFEVSFDEGVLRVETPALIIQPLVENAVAHGLRDQVEGGVVRVEARLEGDLALLTVEDTGVGMSPEEVERIMREGPSADASLDGDPSQGGIGLRNVMRRVSLATGGRGSVSLRSSRGEGTCVRVSLPAGGAAW